LAAVQVTSAYSLPDEDDGLKALVGTVKSGNGDAFVVGAPAAAATILANRTTSLIGSMRTSSSRSFGV
jgi:hypothetical protein